MNKKNWLELRCFIFNKRHQNLEMAFSILEEMNRLELYDLEEEIKKIKEVQNERDKNA